jgi:hypothetical protein
MPIIPNNVHDWVEEFELPDLPDQTDDRDSASLTLFRFDADNVLLAECVPVEDAVAYCNDAHSRGDGYFVGYRLN